VDLLFASSGIEKEVVASAETIEVFPGVDAPVATIGHLIALKVLCRDDVTRPQDRVDLRALLQTANKDDIGVARKALALVTERGANRGRDLLALLDATLLELGPDVDASAAKHE
jgi:hypothetical protein